MVCRLVDGRPHVFGVVVSDGWRISVPGLGESQKRFGPALSVGFFLPGAFGRRSILSISEYWL